jgi:hypothetical protein
MGHGQRKPDRDIDTTHYDVGWILPGSQRVLLPTGLLSKPPRQMVAAMTTCQSFRPGIHKNILQIVHHVAHQ